METTTALPAWIGTTQPQSTVQPTLSPSPQLPVQSNYALTMERQRSIFESMWEQILDRISLGHKLKDIVSDDPRAPEIDMARLNRWILKDSTRSKAFDDAKAMGAHMVLEEMIDIADGKDSMEDVARSTLRVNTRRIYIKAYNRNVFGDNPSMADSSLAGGITINIGQVQSPYTIDNASDTITPVEVLPNE